MIGFNGYHSLSDHTDGPFRRSHGLTITPQEGSIASLVALNLTVLGLNRVACPLNLLELVVTRFRLEVEVFSVLQTASFSVRALEKV